MSPIKSLSGDGRDVEGSLIVDQTSPTKNSLEHREATRKGKFSSWKFIFRFINAKWTVNKKSISIVKLLRLRLADWVFTTTLLRRRTSVCSSTSFRAENAFTRRWAIGVESSLKKLLSVEVEGFVAIKSDSRLHLRRVLGWSGPTRALNHQTISSRIFYISPDCYAMNALTTSQRLGFAAVWLHWLCMLILPRCLQCDRGLNEISEVPSPKLLSSKRQCFWKGWRMFNSKIHIKPDT